MANPLTTADLESVIAEVLPSIQAETSVLTRAGASSVSYNTNVVRSVTLGGPAAVSEGALKPLSDSVVDSSETVRHVLSYILLQSEQFTDSVEGRAIAAESLKQAVQNLVKGLDIMVLSGTDPQTGNAFVPAAGVNLKDNASEHLTAGVAPTDAEIKATLAATAKAKALVLSDAGLSAVQFAESASGFRKYPDASINGTFDFWGVKAHHSEALGIDGWSATEVFENGSVAVAGDFSKIGRSYGVPSVKFYDQALGGIILGDHNLVGYRVEVPVAYYVKDPSSFTILKVEEEEEVPEG